MFLRWTILTPIPASYRLRKQSAIRKFDGRCIEHVSIYRKYPSAVICVPNINHSHNQHSHYETRIRSGNYAQFDGTLGRQTRWTRDASLEI